METKTIKQEVDFSATPEQVYDALMNSKKHSAFTGTTCVISPKIGGKYSAYDGYIQGENVHLIPGKLIVQTWHSADYPDDHESTVTFTLAPTPKGSKLIFVQSDVPESEYEKVMEGWIQYYWEPMEEMFTK